MLNNQRVQTTDAFGRNGPRFGPFRPAGWEGDSQGQSVGSVGNPGSLGICIAHRSTSFWAIYIYYYCYYCLFFFIIVHLHFFRKFCMLRRGTDLYCFRRWNSGLPSMRICGICINWSCLNYCKNGNRFVPHGDPSGAQAFSMPLHSP